MKSLVVALLLFAFQSAQALTLTWTANPAGDNVTVYNVYKRVSANNNNLLGTTANTSFSLDAVPGRKLTLFITAVNVNGESVSSSNIVVQRH